MNEITPKKVHYYAAHYIHDGYTTSIYIISLQVFKPGEIIEVWNGEKIEIEFEL